MTVEMNTILSELAELKSSSLNGEAATRLENIENRLDEIETKMEWILPLNTLSYIKDLIERIVASKNNEGFQLNPQSLGLVQALLHEKLEAVISGECPLNAEERADPGTSGEQQKLDLILEKADERDKKMILKLSKRKREVLLNLLMGMSNREIAGVLGVTEKTVKNHLYALYQVMNVKSRTQLIHRLVISNAEN